MTFRLRPQAVADIEAIVVHIARDSPAAAQRWVDRIRARCRLLGGMPGMGSARPDIRPALRTSAVGNYLILYNEIPGGAEIVRVVHGARDWEALL